MGVSVRGGFALFGLAAGSLLVAGFALGELMSLQPCPLCIFQRLLYLLLVLLALLGVAWPVMRRLWSGLLVLTAAGGVTTAVYQSWLQYFPSPSAECGFGEPTLIEQLVDWFGVRWPSLFMATGFCSSKDWLFLGLSLANWSAVCFLLLTVAALYLFLRRPD
ncbi:MAG: disulfide bond formation protein B [Dokdonella sp.]|nr:MAG: disulfide bond formation protein B [Dokdonella sp.]